MAPPESIEVTQRTGASAHVQLKASAHAAAGRGCNCAAHVALRLLDGRLEIIVVGEQIARDRRRQRTTGTVRVARAQTWRLETSRKHFAGALLTKEEQIRRDQRRVGKMSALHQHRFSA